MGVIFCFLKSEIDECKSNPCKNNGTCNSLVGSYNCTCQMGFTGKYCHLNIYAGVYEYKYKLNISINEVYQCI